ncbi:MAG: Cystathionine gamma-synthase [Chlorobi bacterium]|nr:Cystathionine gamma-synthase [Chlorobiota bacterium]
MNIETIAVHAGERPDRNAGSVIDPIYLSTTFERDADGDYPHGYMYSRNGNPNRDALEECLSALEGGAAAVAFASGMAAIAGIFGMLSPGDHVIAPIDSYYLTGVLLRDMGSWGIEATFVDMTRPADVEAAIRPGTRLVWVETPTNPLLRIVDIAGVAAIAHAAGAICACDNTFATPILQRPLELGADLVMHATTKYLGGHSDVVGGIVVARERGDMFDAIRRTQIRGGAVPSPFDCWLALRGIRTLPYRMRGHSENAAAVADFLTRHADVERVHYPGLRDHPGHEIAARQMKMFGGMVSFQTTGGAARAVEVAARTTLFTRATSLGGVHSLIEHRASIEGPGSSTPNNLLRLSIGLEHPDDLIADLGRALG